jgi:BirA family transcriptional regulator, biotin operon repressor / biotin---[acetyl-CoA-carboxylase] ligase
VVGIGLNVSLTAAEAPDPAATSLLMLGAPDTDRSVLLARILAELAARIDRWRSTGGADPALAADYHRRSVTLGQQVRASLPGDRRIVGTAVAVDDLGRLCIETGGETVTVAAGDITHLRPVSGAGPG